MSMAQADLEIMEGLLFLAGQQGLTIHQLQSALSESSLQEIQEGLASLQKDCERRGVELQEYASRWKYTSKECVFPYARELFKEVRPASLSPAALETLAVIAYRQPVTRAQIEEIRGVSCDTMLKKLAARGLIQAKDRLDAVGRPLLYEVTDTFLDAFSLDNIESLPQLETPDQQEELFKENE